MVTGIRGSQFSDEKVICYCHQTRQHVIICLWTLWGQPFRAISKHYQPWSKINTAVSIGRTGLWEYEKNL